MQLAGPPGAVSQDSQVLPAPRAGHARRQAAAGFVPVIATIRPKDVPLKFQDRTRAAAYLRFNRGGVFRLAAEAIPTEVDGVADAETSVLEYIPGLRRYARALAGDPAEADDLVQECLSRALARRQKCADIRNLRAYLFTILHNAHIDRLNDRQRWNYNISDEFLEQRLSRPAAQPDRLALRELAEALEKLPEEQRQAVLLVGYEGLSYKDAAAALDIPIGTVMSRLSRGREALRRLTSGAPMANLRKVK